MNPLLNGIGIGLIVGAFLAVFGSFVDTRLAGWLFAMGVAFGVALNYIL